MTPTTLLSIVYSFRNEADVLAELILRVDAALSGQSLDYELIFVNDDSDDGSLDLLLAERAKNPRIKIINMSRCFGFAECLKAGLAHASGDAVISMDADLQDPPEVIPDMLDKWRNGAEVVYTVRERREGEPAFRMFVTNIAYNIIRRSSRLHLPVNSGDFRLMSRRAVKEFLRLSETIPYSRGLAMWIGFRRASVSYVRAARRAGESHFPGTFSFGALQSFVAGITSFSMVPLFFILVVGLMAAMVSVVGLVVVLLGAAFPEGSAMVLFMVLLWGSLMASLGIVAVYISRIYSDVRGRPAYIIKDSIGLDAKSES
ncbi:MAG: glycosyltransferase family 2 protein [Proteobacteria bacterium]|nr:glycosyltransferase family 2 protein [Pseudomonadota bacterium]